MQTLTVILDLPSSLKSSFMFLFIFFKIVKFSQVITKTLTFTDFRFVYSNLQQQKLPSNYA